MSRTSNIIISTLMWCAIVAYIVAAGAYSRDRRAGITVKNVRIAIADTAHIKVINPGMVERWLGEGGFGDLTGRLADRIDTRGIERHLAARPEVRRVSAWTDLDSTLTVRIEQRTPLVRIRTTGAGNTAHRFWFTTDGYILPDRGEFTAYVPIVTGNIEFPFPASASGSYVELQQKNYNDFLSRFTTLDTGRKELEKTLAAVSAKLRTTRAEGPKRWWTMWEKLYADEIRAFGEQKAARIAGLESEIRTLGTELAAITRQKQITAEEEKFSYQSHRFLTKLANFVRFIEHDHFWGADIVQINVTERNEIELIPRAGEHTILLGALDGTEKEKLDKLKLFYLKGLWHEGWNKYKQIDIRYANQVVCTR